MEPLDETFRALGLSPGASRIAANGRGHVPADPYDAAVQRHRSLGLSEAAARAAVRGRDHATDEAAARALRAAHRPVAQDGRSTPERRAARLRECRLELDAAVASGDRGRVREATAEARRLLEAFGERSAPSGSSPAARETATYTRLREAGASPAEAAREAARERWGER